MTLPTLQAWLDAHPSPEAVEVGRSYAVPCLQFQEVLLDGPGWCPRLVPVLGPIHADENLPTPHIHIDTRFTGVFAGEPSRGITTVLLLQEEVLADATAVMRQQLAIRSTPISWPVVHPPRACTIADGRCPHRGIPLACGTRHPDGSIECPGHGLRFQTP
jgi:hypothetical protein